MLSFHFILCSFVYPGSDYFVEALQRRQGEVWKGRKIVFLDLKKTESACLVNDFGKVFTRLLVVILCIRNVCWKKNASMEEKKM